MKNIIILIADFYPSPSPNTTCFAPFINKLTENNNVFIVTSYVNGNEHPFTSDNITVYRIKDNKMRNHFKWLRIIGNSKYKIERKTFKLLSYMSKIVREIVYYNPAIDRAYRGWNKKNIKNQMEQLLNTKKIDYIISISHPFITHDVVFELRDKYDFKWYLLEYDAFAFNTFLFKNMDFDKYKKKEITYFNNADKVLLTPQLYYYYSTDVYKEFLHKFYSLEFCNLYRPNISNLLVGNLINKNKISFFYAGAFNVRIRNPKQILDFLSLVDLNFEFSIVTKCDLDFVRKEIEQLGRKISIYSRQSFETVYVNECASNFLISIGNYITYQSPGKTLELLSTGRPIVHFSYIENDPVEIYLKKYPNKLIIHMYKDWEIQIKRFITFTQKEYKTLSFKEILMFCREYHPDYILNGFLELFKEEE